MSASSRSSATERLRRAARSRGLALLAVLAFAGGFAFDAFAATPRAARRITVGPSGVSIEEDGALDSLAVDSSSSPGGFSTRIGDKHVGIVVDADESDIVRLFSDVEIAPGEHVDGDVVAVVGSVRVEGEVTGNVVAVGGSVELLSGARVHGDAVAVGGGLRHDEGAVVNGESVSVGILPIGLGIPAFTSMILTVVVGWLLSVGMGILLAWLFPERLRVIGRMASRRTGASFWLGLVSMPLAAVACFLLLVTVIGIPIALVLPFAYGVAVWAGTISATYVLGCKILRRAVGEGGLLGPVIAGSSFIALFFVAAAITSQPPGFARTIALFLLAFGGLLAFALSWIGTGALLLSRFGSASRPAAEPVAPAAFGAGTAVPLGS